MAYAQLREHRVDGSDLNTLAPAVIAKLCSGDMVAAVWHEKRQRSEAGDDLLGGPWTVKSLQQLLKHEARGEDSLTSAERIRQTFDLVTLLGCIPTQSDGPNRRVDEQVQSRDRSSL